MPNLEHTKSNLPSVTTGIDDDGDDLGEVQDESGRSVADDSSSENESQVPARKRTRTSLTSTKTRKRYVRGKQGGLKGLMEMPIEIFTEIAYLLTPGDLIALARSSKFFRGVLLQRSAIHMWRRAQQNMPRLPSCPFHMCEPQYAALVFSKSCTLCGASATAKLDPNLHVRLCPSCRDTQLRELTPWNRRAVVDKTLVNHSYATRPKTEKKRPRYSEHPIYGLRQEINEVLKKQRQFQSAGHMDRLAKWEEERRKLVSARYKHGKRLAVYLESIETSRGEELSNLKQQRREDIKERLKALGWTNKDMKFSDSHAKPWRALVDPPKPLTERIWKNILPKLTALLEENRERHIAHGKLVRQIQRREHIHKFLLRLKNAEHPLEPIVDPLGAELPPHGSDDSDSFDSVRYFELGNPFPNTSFALAWDCLADLSEREIPVEEVQAELEARTAQIRQKVLEWKSGVERKLGEKYKNGAEGVRQDVVAGSTDLTAHLSRDLRLLLRADTVFKKLRPRLAGSSDESDNPPTWSSPFYYPELVSSLRGFFYESPDFPEDNFSAPEDINLEGYQRDPECEKTIKQLLRSLGMPDVARIELRILGSRFICGRCIDKSPKTWDKMVRHYVAAPSAWSANKSQKGEYPVRHPVVYRDVHDFAWAGSGKPLVRLLTPEEAADLSELPPRSKLTLPSCLPCEGTGKAAHRLRKEDMMVHLRDVHDIADPVRGIHYGDYNLDVPGPKWHERWDWFYDAQASGSTPKWLPSSPSSEYF